MSADVTVCRSLVATWTEAKLAMKGAPGVTESFQWWNAGPVGTMVECFPRGEKTGGGKNVCRKVRSLHDDSVEPGNTYRYRIRLGVFNPVAETDQISPEDKSKKNDVILWSNFSKTTQAIEIPERLYFFPLDVREGAKTVTVQVFRYVLGYWHGNPFRVQQGEVIGRAVENKKVENQTTAVTADVAEPETIDYGTGVVLVDVRTVNGWSRGGNTLRPQYCPDMLYSLDGTTIEHMPIGQLNWPKELHTKYLEVKKLAEKPHKPLRGWGSKATRRKEYTRERTREESSERSGEDSRRASEEESWRRMMEKRGMKF
ncbi:MAG: hypothetical protein ACYS21_06145 [Planctomycetota bacterium]